MQPIRILVATPYFYPHSGGSQQYIEDLYLTLKKKYAQVEVDVVCYNTERVTSEEEYQGLHIHRLPCWEILPGQFALPNYLSLINLLRQLKKKHGQYQVVNAHTRFFDTAWWGWLAAKYLDSQSILTDHCAFHPSHPNALVSAVTRAVDYLVTPFLGKVYDQVTVVSQETQNWDRKLGIKKSAVIYGGVDTKLFTSKQKSDQLLISFVGRLIPAKRALLFKEALVRILKKYPHVSAVIAGEGPLKTEVEQNLPPRVSVIGRLSHSEVASLLSRTSIFVHPSTHHEGFPLTLVEAGAAGCAIVTTTQGGTKELITDESLGLFIQPTVEDIEKKITYLIENESVRKKLAKNIRQRVVDHFSWEKSASKFAEVIGLT